MWKGPETQSCFYRSPFVFWLPFCGGCQCTGADRTPLYGFFRFNFSGALIKDDWPPGEDALEEDSFFVSLSKSTESGEVYLEKIGKLFPVQVFVIDWLNPTIRFKFYYCTKICRPLKFSQALQLWIFWVWYTSESCDWIRFQMTQRPAPNWNRFSHCSVLVQPWGHFKMVLFILINQDLNFNTFFFSHFGLKKGSPGDRHNSSFLGSLRNWND